MEIYILVSSFFYFVTCIIEGDELLGKNKENNAEGKWKIYA